LQQILHFFAYASLTKMMDQLSLSLITKVTEPLSEQETRLAQELFYRQTLILNFIKDL